MSARKMSLQYSLRLFVVVVAACVTPATAWPQSATPTPEANAVQSSASALPLADGEVRRIDKATGRITLRHGPIPNLDMAPMTMVFRVSDASLIEKLKVGDRIRFSAEKVPGGYAVTYAESAP